MSSTGWSMRSHIRFLHEISLVFGYLRDFFLSKGTGEPAVNIDFSAEDQKLPSSFFSCRALRQTLIGGFTSST